jgi:hypothetical protein
MRLSGRSALSLNTYRLWSGMSAMVLLVTPSLPWVTAQPPGSLLYVVFTWWQDTLEHLFLRDIVVASLVSLGVASMYLYAVTTLLTVATRHHVHWTRAFGLITSTCFFSWMLWWVISVGGTDVGWGFWMGWAALLTSWGTNVVQVLQTCRGAPPR